MNRVPFAIALLLGMAAGLSAQTNVLMNRYDNSGTGSNLQETQLNNSNVSPSAFGMLYSYPVDGSVYAQPLYVANLAIPNNGTHNVLFAATMNDKLYAFDADRNLAPLWTRDFTNPSAGITSIPIVNIVNSNSLNIVGNVGIEGTPVINLASKTMYLVVRTLENGAFLQRLHAVDITTGAEKSGSPVTIQASVTGTASDSVNSVLSFNPMMEQQRPGLVLVNGLVVITWGSHEDDLPFHGWVMTYNATTLAQQAALCLTPNGSDAGIWQAGRAPVVDSSGAVYFMTGNGDWDGVAEFGDSLLKVGVGASSLTVLDWFTPADQNNESINDRDFGSSGPMLIPGFGSVVGGGKEGAVYVLNSANLGHLTTNDSTALQQIAAGGAVFTGPAFWTSPSGPLAYLWVNSGFPTAYLYKNSTPYLTQFAVGTVTSPSAGALTISANGSLAGTGVLWANYSTSQSAYHGVVAGTLGAFDAQTLNQLWTSDSVPARDQLGTLAKYVPPVVTNGRVYQASWDGSIHTYGLLASFTTPNFNVSVGAGAQTQTTPPGQAASYPITVASQNGFTGTVALTASGLPSGATATFAPSSLSNGAGSSALQVSTSSATPAGTYPLTVTGTSGTLVSITTIRLVVSSTAPNFTVTVGSGAQTVAPGQTASYPVTVASQNSFSGTVALSIAGLPAGASAAFTPASISGAGGSSLKVSTSSSTPVGGYTLTISGTSGALVNTATTQLVVSTGAAAPAISIDFVGTGTAMAATETAGVVALTNWNLASGAASTAPLALLSAAGAGTGATISWAADNTWGTAITDSAGNARMMKGYLDNGALNPTVITVSNLPVSSTGYDVYVYVDGANGGATRTGTYQISGAGIVTSAITATDAANADFSGTFVRAANGVGNYIKFTITAVGFTLTATPGQASDNTLRAPVNGIQIVPSVSSAPNFTLNVGSGGQTVSPGQAAGYPLTVASQGGFSGTVALTLSGLPVGASATFTPNSVSGAGGSTLQVLTSSSTPGGGYTLTVTGTSGTLVNTATTQLIVSSGASAPAISVDFIGTGTAMAATETAGVVALANWNQASGAASATPLALLSSSGASTGASVSWRSDNTWSTAITDSPGNARMMKGYLDNGALHATVVTVSNLPVSSTGYDIYVYADGANGSGTHTGSYQISGAGIVTAVITATDAANTDFSGTFTQATNSVGNYVKFTINSTAFTLTATPGTASDNTLRAPVNGIQIVPSALSAPNFTVTAGSTTQTAPAGQTASYPVTVASQNGFTGTVALSVSGLPSGATAAFTPTSVSGAGGSTLQVSTSASTPVGSYTLTIIGTSGTLVNAATTQLVVSTSVTASAISIDFAGTNTPMAATETAGVVALANWNQASGAASATPLALLGSTGASTGATVVWKADNTWSTAIADSPGNSRMMKGYLDNGALNPTVIAVSNLPVSSTGYDIYVYIDGQNGAATRTAAYQISGSGIVTSAITATDAASTDFPGSFVQATNSAGNYVKFTINATAFTLTATPGTASDNTLRAPVNGIQIVAH